VTDAASHGGNTANGLEVDRQKVNEYKQGATDEEREDRANQDFTLLEQLVNQHRMLPLLVLDGYESHQEKAESK
jgi:hypothetical protein